jgi:hypothetical protein
MELTKLKLPSGAEILARKPTALLLGSLGLGLDMASKGRGDAPGGSLTDDGVKDLAEAMGVVLRVCYVSPRLSLEPSGPDEIHPSQIANEDCLFVLRWALGKSDAPFKPKRIRHAHTSAGRRSHEH